MTSLPNYGKPPVNEVAIGLQFLPIDGFTIAHVGLFWEKIREKYNIIEEQPPIVPIIEPPELLTPRNINISLHNRPDLPRTWFLNEKGTQLIQLQRDRFLYNWRKMADNEEYPRYLMVKENLLKEWRGFCTFLSESNISLPQLNQCDLTYINHIKQGKGWKSIKDIFEIFTFLNWRTRSDFLADPESIGCKLAFPLPENNGRLHVEVSLVRAKIDNSLIVSFSLTARGFPPNNKGEESIIEWYDVARESIVKGFADLTDNTTDSMWEKKI